MEKRILLLAMWLLTVCMAFAATPSLAGIYKFKDSYSGEDAKVKIYDNGKGGYDARIVWLAQPNNPDGSPRLDEKNPDPALRTRKAYEIVVAKNLKYNEKKQRWETKELYHPSYGKYFSAYMEFESATRLKVRGYVGAPALGQTEYWEKTE